MAWRQQLLLLWWRSFVANPSLPNPPVPPHVFQGAFFLASILIAFAWPRACQSPGVASLLARFHYHRWCIMVGDPSTAVKVRPERPNGLKAADDSGLGDNGVDGQIVLTHGQPGHHLEVKSDGYPPGLRGQKQEAIVKAGSVA